MNVLNLDGALCGLDIDLSCKLHNLPKLKYIITQNILNGIKCYTIINTWNNKILYPDDDFNVSLLYSTGNQIKISMKKIVRLIYDSEYCIDDIEDEPGEFWRFIDLYEVSKNRKHPVQNSKESFLVSSHGRIKSYKHNHAEILTQYPKNPESPETSYYYVYLKCDNPKLKVYVHRLVAQYINGPLQGILPFDFTDLKVEVHHSESKRHNECYNLIVCLDKKVHAQFDAAKRAREKAKIEQKEYLVAA